MFSRTAGRRPRYSLLRIVGWIVFVAMVLVASLILAALMSLSVVIIDLVIVGGIAGGILLFLPLNWLIMLFLVAVFLMTGQLVYFANLVQAHWIPYLFAFLFYIRLPVEMIRLRHQEAKRRLQVGASFDQKRAGSAVIGAFVCYVVVIAVSTIFNHPPALQAIVGLRTYLFLWSLMLILAFSVSDETLFDRIWQFFVFTAFFQFPVAIFQAIFVVKYLGSSWDAVSGSFGGYMSGAGGGSGGMAIFLLWILAYGLTQWRDGHWSARRILTYFVAMMGTVLLAEVKIVLVSMPVIVLLILWKKIFFRPLQGILILGGLGIVLVGTFFVYQQAFWGEGLGLESESSWKVKMEKTLDYLFAMEGDPDFINPESGEVSRVSSVVIWYREHQVSYDTIYSLVGHGPGASRRGQLMGDGELASRYNFVLTTHTLSRLLWDFGLFGALSFIGMLLVGAYRARALSKSELVPERTRSTFFAVSIMLLLEVPLLMYQSHLGDMSPNQTLLVMVLGHIAYWDLAVKRGKKRVPSTQEDCTTMIEQSGSSLPYQVSLSTSGGSR